MARRIPAKSQDGRLGGRPRRRALRSRPACLLIGGALVLGLPAGASAAVFAPAFQGPTLDAGLAASGSAGTGYTVGGGTLTLTQAAGGSEGLITVSTTAAVVGDFVATVTASGTGLGAADLGLYVGVPDFSHSLADVFLNDTSDTVNGNVFQPSFSGAFTAKGTDTVRLTITRRGDTVTDLYDVGGGATVLNSGTDPALGADTTINLFLLDAVGDDATHRGEFVNLQIATGADAAELLAEPGACVAAVALVFMLVFVRRSRPSPTCAAASPGQPPAAR